MNGRRDDLLISLEAVDAKNLYISLQKKSQMREDDERRSNLAQ